ncbi:MAG: collagen-like protein, partial [Clostridia bacterium]|nr:collagen-like protein [Clostridia bacterium]
MNMQVSFEESTQNSSAFGVGFHDVKIENGKDGISATHRWEGTKLTITSASGSSSADLKGDKGDRGEDGKNGKDGQDGKDGVSIYKVGTYRSGDGAYSSDLSTVELPEGRTLQVGDFLLHADGTLLQVTQIGNAEISDYWLGCAFVLNTKGAQGPQGEKGDTGAQGPQGEKGDTGA